MEKKTHKLLEKEQNKTNIFWLNKLKKYLKKLLILPKNKIKRRGVLLYLKFLVLLFF